MLLICVSGDICLEPDICLDADICGNSDNCKLYSVLDIRVSKNDRSLTPRYGVVAKMVYYIYDDTW